MVDIEKLRLTEAHWGVVDWIRDEGKGEDAFIMECEDVAEWLADKLQAILEQHDIPRPEAVTS